MTPVRDRCCDVACSRRDILGHFATGLGGVPHPLLSDFHPKGTVLQAYGVYNDQSGTARRSVFIIDKAGTVRWSNLYQPGTIPNPDEVLAELVKVKG